MGKRILLVVFVVFVVAGVGVVVWLNLQGNKIPPPTDMPSPTSTTPVTEDQFTESLRTDPIAALNTAVAAYPAGGFTAEFRKRERMSGKLADEEVIRVSVQDDPYSVLMLWQSVKNKGTLYAGGKMKVAGIPIDVNPQGFIPRQSARYTIEEFGLVQSTKRTLRAWAAAKTAGELTCEYVGRKAVPEAGGQECFVLKRTCSADQIDPFVTGGPKVDVTDKNRRDSFRTVSVYLDCETRQQVGTEQHRHDGELTASYWFRDVKLNATFDADTFTVKSFK